jgi:hypothetical protein
MGKFKGVIGGFFIGLLIMVCISFLMVMTMGSVFTSVGISTSEGMESANTSPTNTSVADAQSTAGGAVALMIFGYFAGWIASIWFGYGYSYDTGVYDGKNPDL